MQQGPVQVTVVEYVNEFFKNYTRQAYGKTLAVNASKGAETLMGMLKLVLSRGGRDELRIALHCFKDQLTVAINSPASVREQQVDELFALLAALVDAAERLRQFSPVKEQLSTAVLEEVRFRLYRIIVGDGFCEDAALRRRALDLTFSGLMQEAAEQERSRARLHKLSSTGPSVSSSSANGALAIVAAHQLPPSAAAAGSGAGSGAGRISEPGAKGPGRLRGSLQRKAAALSGPDFSSWEGLWSSLATMSPRRMLPLLQMVMTDLYMGHTIPGTPGAAAAAAAAAATVAPSQPLLRAESGSNGCTKHPSQNGSISGCQQQAQVPLDQQHHQQQHQKQQQQQQHEHVKALQQQHSLPTDEPGSLLGQSDKPAVADTQGAAAAAAVAQGAPGPSASSSSEGGNVAAAGSCPRCAAAGSNSSTSGGGVGSGGAGAATMIAAAAAAAAAAVAAATRGRTRSSSGSGFFSDSGGVVGNSSSTAPAPAGEQQQQQQVAAGPGGVPEAVPSLQGNSSQAAEASVSEASPQMTGTSSISRNDSTAPVAEPPDEQLEQAQQQQAAAEPQQQQQQQPQQQRFGRSSMRSAHPIAAGYGASLSSHAGNTPSPKLSSTPTEGKGSLASLASRFSGGGGGGGGSGGSGGGASNKGVSPGSAGNKWGNIAGGFLGLQSSGSGRLIPRGWVQFGNKPHAPAGASTADPANTESDADADAFAVEGAVDAGVLQQQHDQVATAAEPSTPSKAAAAATAAAASGATPEGNLQNAETGQPHDTGSAVGSTAVGFGGDEPAPWHCFTEKTAAPAGKPPAAAAPSAAQAVHCRAAPAPAVAL